MSSLNINTDSQLKCGPLLQSSPRPDILSEYILTPFDLLRFCFVASLV